MGQTISYNDFTKIKMVTGTIISVEKFTEAIKPAYKLKIDFGKYGILKSSAQITLNYTLEDLEGRQIIGIINFAPKQIGPFISECLVLGLEQSAGDVMLLKVDKTVENGLDIS